MTPAATLDLQLTSSAPVFAHDFWAAAPMTDRNMNPNMTGHWLVSDAEMRASGEYELLGWHGPGGVAADAVVSLRESFHVAMWRGLLSAQYLDVFVCLRKICLLVISRLYQLGADRILSRSPL